MPSDAYHKLAVQSAYRALFHAINRAGFDNHYNIMLLAVDAGDIKPVELDTSFRVLERAHRAWVKDLLVKAAYTGGSQYIPGNVKVAYETLIRQLELLGNLQHPRLRLTLGQLKLTLPQLRELGKPLGLSHLVDEADLVIGSWSRKKSA
jgi:hypothetical protein